MDTDYDTRSSRIDNLVLFILATDLALAGCEYCLITFGVWLGHNFNFVASGVTMAILQTLIFLLLLYIYGKCLYKAIRFRANRDRSTYASIFSAKLVFFPWVHVLMFLGLVALYTIKSQLADGPVVPWAKATLRLKSFYATGLVGYGCFLVYAPLAWFVLFREFRARHHRSRMVAAMIEDGPSSEEFSDESDDNLLDHRHSIEILKI